MLGWFGGGYLASRFGDSFERAAGWRKHLRQQQLQQEFDFDAWLETQFAECKTNEEVGEMFQRINSAKNRVAWLRRAEIAGDSREYWLGVVERAQADGRLIPWRQS